MNEKKNHACSHAALYYYDYLHADPQEPIPDNMATHIDQCAVCQRQLDQLRQMLSKSNKWASKKKQLSKAIEKLKSHFQLVNKQITCGVVKPFLPGLAEPTGSVRTPTPITVHIQHCKPCSADLQTIITLNFTPKQLAQLKKVFDGTSPETALESFKGKEQVRGILNRPDSNITTCYRFDNEDSRQDSASTRNALYAGWPINVQVDEGVQ
jgi:hypothetical protein